MIRQNQRKETKYETLFFVWLFWVKVWVNVPFRYVGSLIMEYFLYSEHGRQRDTLCRTSVNHGNFEAHRGKRKKVQELETEENITGKMSVHIFLK